MPSLLTCAKCRALLEPGTKVCPYCQTSQRHKNAPTPQRDAETTARIGLWLVGILVLIYVMTVTLDPAKGDREEAFTPTAIALNAWGATHPVFVGHCGQYWRLITAMFLHADLIHLLFNCVAIFFLLPLAAATLGADRSICTYVAGGLVGSFASHAITGAMSVGASGAVCGIIAAVGVWGWRRGGLEGQLLSRRMLMWGVFIGVYGLVVPGIDNAGHFGGFAGGALFGRWASTLRIRGSSEDRVWRWGAIASLVLLVAALGFGMAPSVARSFDRRDVMLHHDDLVSVLTALREGDLPEEDLSAAPGGSEDVNAAVARARAAARAGSPDKDAAWREAMDAFAMWEKRILCRYGIGLRRRGAAR